MGCITWRNGFFIRRCRKICSRTPTRYGCWRHSIETFKTGYHGSGLRKFAVKNIKFTPSSLNGGSKSGGCPVSISPLEKKQPTYARAMRLRLISFVLTLKLRVAWYTSLCGCRPDSIKTFKNRTLRLGFVTQPSKSAAHRDEGREWNVSKQNWNLT